jgi:uncharacterized protein
VLQVLELPDNTAIQGPVQVHQKMTNQENARQELTLLESSESKPEFGNLLSLPLGGGMLYVQPVYIRSTQANNYPLLKKVLVNYGDYAGYAETLEQGLQQLIAQATGKPVTTPPAGQPPPNASGSGSDAVADAVARLQTAINEYRAALQSGDFERIGRALKAVEDAMKAFEEAKKAAAAGGGTTPSPSPSGSPAPGASPQPSPSR